MSPARHACLAPRPGSRRFEQPEDGHRTPFQRDCDRIVHSNAFRLLMHKTQVFVAPLYGQYRTRLTHTIEVARVARSLASALRLNPDLAEAVALAHDLGHAPFGHIGEETLARLMQEHGGFDHNAQAIRIVTRLERSYIRFDGLNLTWETLEGIAKHNGPIESQAPRALAEYSAQHDLQLDTWPSAEAQVAALADDIAYNCHDLLDGLRAGLFRSAEIAELPIVGGAYEDVRSEFPGAESERIDHTALRRVFNCLAENVLATSDAELQRSDAGSVDDIRNAGRRLVRFSENCFSDMKVIRSFLKDRMYRSNEIMRQCERGSEAVESLFRHFMRRPSDLPERWKSDYQQAVDPSGQARAVADHIAGMTDSHALAERDRVREWPVTNAQRAGTAGPAETGPGQPQ